jgi:hypothetical protein
VAFEVEKGVGVARGGVGDEFGVFGAQEGDVFVEVGEEDGFAIAHEFGEPDGGDGQGVIGGAVHLADEPFGVADEDPGAGGDRGVGGFDGFKQHASSLRYWGT